MTQRSKLILGKVILGVTMGVGLIGLSVASASASVVCSERVCWHTNDGYDYPRGAHIIVHPDNWRWGPREHFAWREHEGRGYWRGGHWVEW